MVRAQQIQLQIKNAATSKDLYTCVIEVGVKWIEHSNDAICVVSNIMLSIAGVIL